MLKIASLSALLLPFAASAQPDTASTIIAMERAALDRSDKGDPGAFLDISDPDVVYLDPFIDRPIYGLENLRAYYRKVFGNETATGEMLNPKVQVFGDTAVLTFGYLSKLQNGVQRRWHTTEVFRRAGKTWRIVHTHWALLQSQPS